VGEGVSFQLLEKKEKEKRLERTLCAGRADERAINNSYALEKLRKINEDSD